MYRQDLLHELHPVLIYNLLKIYMCPNFYVCPIICFKGPMLSKIHFTNVF